MTEEITPDKNIASAMVSIADFSKEASEKIIQQASQLKKLIELIMKVYQSNQRLFVMGEGRSGLVGRAFAMRARHLDFHAHVIGESTTPRVRENDLVMVISGSGTTSTNITHCLTIIEIGADIVAITSKTDSPLGRLADVAIELPGREGIEDVIDYNRRHLIGGPPLAPLGTLFEITALIFLDALIQELMPLTKTTEKEMEKRHSI